MSKKCTPLWREAHFQVKSVENYGDRNRFWTGVDPCSRDLLLASASVRKRPQPFATVRNRPFAAVVASKLPCLWEKSQKHDFFDVGSRFVWQAQYICHIFRRCVAFFVARAALWTPPMPFSVAGAALWTVVLRVFCESHCQSCAKW